MLQRGPPSQPAIQQTASKLPSPSVLAPPHASPPQCVAPRPAHTVFLAFFPSSPAAGAFENVVQALYKYAVPKPKAECSKGEQLGVSFAAGYIAGIFCAVVSHPADNLVSKMNSMKGVPASE